MKITQLEYFCATCRHHSITQAARELYVTQPAISSAIRELEGIFHQSFRPLEKPYYTHKEGEIILSESPGHAALY
ncbi:MAG: LysR family transcriptional regulator [Dorea sp.]